MCDPRAVFVGDGDDLLERVERAAVHVAGLGAHDRRPVEAGQHLAQGVGSHPALGVAGDPTDARPLAAQAEHLERRVDGHVRALVGHDGHLRSTLQSLALHVPADLRQHGMAGRRERREVGHRRAGHEPDARAGRQLEQIHQPAGGDLLGDGRRRRQDVQAGVLVPRAGQPVGRERRGQPATDDEPEVARPGARDEPGVGGRGQRFDNGQWLRRAIRERAAHRGPELRDVDRAPDGTRLETRQVGGGDLGRAGQQCCLIGHRSPPRPGSAESRPRCP